MARVDPPGISVVCVYNDPDVRRQCLDSSLDAADAGGVELVAVDNVEHAFSSAGAALNHGARRARHEVVVFVHQDVYLHSVTRLRELAAHLRGDTWGMIGACGIAADGTVVGTMRDRVQLIGIDAPRPLPVDTIDEVLFMIRRDRVLEHPLSEQPELSWHAYSVEYSLRLRRLGLLTGAANAAITHNSLTINLDKLDVAHGRVAEDYADQLPVRTTCGTLGRRVGGLRRLGFVRRHGWRKRWFLESRLALTASRRSAPHRAPHRTVLADIRLDVDALAWTGSPLRVVNLDPAAAFSTYAARQLTLSRLGRLVRLDCVSRVQDAVRLLAEGGPDASFLVTNLSPADLRALTASMPGPGPTTLLGVHERHLWLLVGPVAHRCPAAWSEQRAVPLLAGQR